MAATAALHIHKFWTKYEQDPADRSKLVPIDWVAYGPIGGLAKSVTHDRISRLRALQPLAGSQNPAVLMAHDRWSHIEKYYTAWKDGQEAPVSGTALAAWNAISAEQADVFRTNGVKTVEDIAALTDTHVSRFPIPDLRNLIRQAQNFIDASEQTRLAGKLHEKDEEIAALRDENRDRDGQIAALMAKVDQFAEMVAAQQIEQGEQAPRRGPGRPPKGAVTSQGAVATQETA